jgi:hypothetical protein
MSPEEMKVEITAPELEKIAIKYDLNGRQIENAIKASQLLASKSEVRKVLTAEIINSVLEITILKVTNS